MLKILFITSATHTPSDRNFNHFQRVYFLSRHTALTILGCKGASFAASAKPETKIVHAPWSGKAGLLLYGFFWILAGKAREFDIVLTEPTILGVLGLWAKVISRCKWAVDVWDIPIRFKIGTLITKARCRAVRAIMRRLYRSADLFIISILPEFELSEFGIPKEKMFLVPNAIWLDKKSIQNTGQGNGSFSILCMRSIHYTDMGLDTLAQAFLKLNSNIDNLSLTIIGRIPEEVRPQLAAIEKLPNVRLLKFVEHERLKKLIRNSSVAVIPFKNVPDLAQTYPIKVLEYFTQGTVVLASNIAGMSRMIEDGKNGLLFRAGDPDGLAEKILRLRRDEQLRINLGKNAMKIDEKYDCVKKNEKIIKALENLATN